MLRRIMVLVLSVIFLVFAIPFSTLAEPSDLVIISDPGLKSAIKEILNIEYDDITVSDMESLTGFISFNGRDIIDLTGIEHAKNITGLDLGNNSISDILPLQGLTGLRMLLLYNNQINDIDPLVGNADAGGLVSEDADDYVDLRYNYLDLSDGSANMEDIDYLATKGINVIYLDDAKPFIVVNPQERNIMGIDWTSGSDVEISISNNDVEVFKSTTLIDNNGQFSVGIDDVSKGFVVTVTDGVTTKTHVIADIEITGIDEQTDKIHGRADPDAIVNVNIYADEMYTRMVSADEQGFWTADFSTAGPLEFEKAVFDIRPGVEGNVQVRDDDLDATEARFRINDPYFIADLSEMSIYGEQWEPYSVIAVSINDGSKYIGSVTADEYGSIRKELYKEGIYIDVGDIIGLSTDKIVKNLTIKNIFIDEVSIANDTVSGNTDADIEIWVHVFGDNVASRSVISDENGNWQVDFSVSENPYDNISDIVAGTRGCIDISNEQGNITRKIWYAGGGISGKITGSDESAVTGSEVTAFKVIDENNREYAGFTLADPQGKYILEGLSNGSYEVEARAPGKIRAVYGSLVIVSDEGFTSGIDFILESGGSISGRVTDKDGNPLENVSVDAWIPDMPGNGTTTDVNGYYSIDGLSYGEYEMQTPSNGRWAENDSSWIINRYDQKIDVNENSPDISNVDFILEKGGSISGTVKDAAGNFVEGARVWVHLSTGIDSMEFMGEAFTIATGSYIIDGLPEGSYMVEAEASGMTKKTYDNVYSQQDMTPVIVTGTNETGNIDFILETGGQISGRITDKDGNPIAHVSVEASGANDSGNTTETDDNGFYTIENLPVGEYEIYAPSLGKWAQNDKAWMAEKYYQNIVLNELDLYIANIDFVLEKGGSISGKVTDEQGVPLENAHVWVHIRVDQDQWEHRGGVNTDTLGEYIIEGLADGVYSVEAEAPGTIRAYYNDAQSIEDASFITIVDGSPVIGIDFELEKGGSISGRITDKDGNPLQNISVDAIAADLPGSGSKTDSNGFYIISGIKFATYKIVAPSYGRWGENDKGWLAVEYQNIVTINETESEAVGINFVLEKGGTISGKIKDTSGSPIEKVRIRVHRKTGPDKWENYVETDSDPSGIYKAEGLPDGEYAVEVEAADMIREFYDNESELDAAELIIITGAGFVNDIDFVLERGGSISGRVTDKDGNPLANVSVDAWIPDRPGHGIKTDENGYYTISGLEKGIFDMQSPSNGRWGENDEGWIIVKYTGQVEITDEKLDVSGIDFILEKGGSISGNVKDKDGNPLVNVSVDAWMPNLPGHGTKTDGNGNYTISGLEKGNYEMQSPSFGRWGENDDGWIIVKHPDGISINDESLNITGIDFTLEKGGSISGNIKGVSGSPLENVRVRVHRKTGTNSWDFAGEGDTDTVGSYIVEGLADGEYLLETDAEGMIREYYDNVFKQEDATLVTITGGERINDIDFILETGGSISGRVTDKDGNPLINISVDAWIPDQSGHGTKTDENGYYTISGLQKGSYSMQSPSNGRWGENDEGWIIIKHPDTIIISEAALNITDIDFMLEKGGGISGKVTNIDGNALSGVRVKVHIKINETLYEHKGEVETNSFGEYEVTGLKNGDYIVEADAQGMIREYFDNVRKQEDASLIGIRDAGTVYNIDFSLERGGSISGRVTDKDGIPLADVSVDAWIPDYNGHGARTDENGYYMIGGLEKGIYQMQSPSFGRWSGNDSGWIPVKYPDTVVISESSFDMTGIDFVLEKGGSISGNIKGVSGSPLENVRVRIHRKTGTNSWDFAGEGDTDPVGSYIVEGLPDGEYLIETEAEGMIREYYNNVLKQEDATLITITDAGIITDIDFVLEKGGSISGRITDKDGNPLSGVSVDAWMPDIPGQGTMTDGNGNYTISGLQKGSYSVQSPSFGRWGDNDADRIIVKYFEMIEISDLVNDVAGIDFVLETGGRITGKVTDKEGNPVVDARIQAQQKVGDDYENKGEVEVDSAGEYVISGLPDGTYVVEAYSQGKVRVFYDNSVRREDAAPLYIVEKSEVNHVDFILEKGGSISGRVTDSDGNAQPKVSVEVIMANGNSFGAVSDDQGNYFVSGISLGEYEIWAPGRGRWGENDSDWAIAKLPDNVILTDSIPDAQGIDIVLSSGGSISGRIKDKAGNPLANISVEAQIADSPGVSTKTDANGYYTLRGLGYGTYELRSPGFGRWAENDGGWISVKYHEFISINETQNDVVDMDFILEKGGSISGTVRDTNSAPIEKAQVRVFLKTGGNEWDFKGDVMTNASGEYLAEGLPDGQYKVESEALSKARRIYDNTYIDEDITLVNISSSSIETGIDFILESGGSISGHITDKSGNPLMNVSVDIFLENGYGAGAQTDKTGYYIVNNIPYGEYSMVVPSFGRYAQNDPFWISVNPLEKTVVNEIKPEVENMDFILIKGGAAKGRVVDELNDPVPGARVRISSYVDDALKTYEQTYSSNDGRYAFDGLMEGDYYIEAEADDKAFTIYDGVYLYADASKISIVAGQTVTDVDFTVKEGGSISGRITDISGNPLADISVEAYVDGVITRSVKTDVDGNYTIANLPYMQYNLRAPSGTRWASNDMSWEENIYAGIVEINGENRDVTGIDFELEERTLFIVSFDSKAGTPVADVLVPVDSLLNKPADPVRSGHIFAGWFKDDELTIKWNFNDDKVDNDITLKAKWYLAGDLNGDAKVNTVDALITLQIASGRITDPGEYRLTVADVNKDGRVNTIDALIILQFVSGRISVLYATD